MNGAVSADMGRKVFMCVCIYYVAHIEMSPRYLYISDRGRCLCYMVHSFYVYGELLLDSSYALL